MSINALKPILYVEIADPAEAFGSVTVPQVSMAETMREAWRIPGRLPTNVRYDEALNCLYLEPTRISADEDLAVWTKSGGTFKLVLNRVTGNKVIRQTAAPTATEWTAERGTAGNTFMDSGQGLHLWLYRDAPRSGSTRDAASCYVAARILDAAGNGYRVLWAYGQGPRLESTADSGATWTLVGDLPLADAGRAQSGAWGEVLIEMVRINGRMAFRAGQNNALAEGSLTVPDLDLIYPLRISGKGVNAAFTAARAEFPTSGTFVNSTRELPWNNTSAPVAHVDGSVNSTPSTQNAPDGVTWALDRDEGLWTWRYTLTLTGDGTQTPWVTMVRAILPSIQVAPDPSTVWTQLPYVDGFRLQHRFSPSELTVRSAGALHVYNHGGQFAAAYGNRAVRVWAGQWDEYGVLWGGPDNANGLRFVGFLGLDSDLGAEEGWLSLDSRLFQLERKAFYNGPQGDYYCIYYNFKTAVQHAGIADDWLYLSPDTPADAWTCDGITCDHPHVGGGTGFQPAWRPEQGEKVWQYLQRMRARYGMALGFTPDSHFTAYPWTPWNARAAWSPKQVFGSIPAYDAYGRSKLSHALRGVRKRTSIRELVNSLTLMGLDQATWEPIVAHMADPASVRAGWGTMPPPNYLGFLADAVESSIAYASTAELNDVLARLFNVVSQPRLTMQIPAWGQPLQVCDYVGVDASLARVLPGADKFWVSGIDEDWRTILGQDGATQRYTMDFDLEMVPYDKTGLYQFSWGKSDFSSGAGWTMAG